MSWFSPNHHRQPGWASYRQRQAAFEALEQRTLLAGDISLVRYFDTWNADPQIIRSTDVAGITYHPPSRHLYLADSEINEIPEIFNGDNLFEVSLRGDEMYRSIASNNTEPTGITYNAFDGFFYVTNDNTKRLTRYDDRLTTPLAMADTRQAVANANDPEDVASDPETGFLYVVDGVDGGIQVLVYDSNLSFQYSFPVSSQATDPEGIAFHPVLRHLFLVSARDKKIFEYTLDGNFVEEFDYRSLLPRPTHPSGLTFAPTSDSNDDSAAISLYVSDEGQDNYPDGRIFETSITGARPPVVVYGTAEDDVFMFVADSASGQPVLTVNGVEHPIPAGSFLIELDGAGGDDQVRFVGGDDVDTAMIRPNAAVVHSGVHKISAFHMESIGFDGAGGSDVARIYGSRRANALSGGGEAIDPQQTTLAGGGVSITATAETLYADGRHGKNTATLPDSPADVVQQFWKSIETRHDPDLGVVGDDYSRLLRHFGEFSYYRATAFSAPTGDTPALLLGASEEHTTLASLPQTTPLPSELATEFVWLAWIEQAAAQRRATDKTVLQDNRLDEVFAYWE